MSFSQQETDWTSKRLTQTGNKSAYTDHSESGFGQLRQLDDKTANINNIQIGDGYRLIIDLPHDIIVTDKIVIESEEYEVRGVKEERNGSIEVKELLLVYDKS